MEINKPLLVKVNGGPAYGKLTVYGSPLKLKEAFAQEGRTISDPINWETEKDGEATIK